MEESYLNVYIQWAILLQVGHRSHSHLQDSKSFLSTHVIQIGMSQFNLLYSNDRLATIGVVVSCLIFEARGLLSLLPFKSTNIHAPGGCKISSSYLEIWTDLDETETETDQLAPCIPRSCTTVSECHHVSAWWQVLCFCMMSSALLWSITFLGPLSRSSSTLRNLPFSDRPVGASWAHGSPMAIFFSGNNLN
jgi:hypothetical protein